MKTQRRKAMLLSSLPVLLAATLALPGNAAEHTKDSLATVMNNVLAGKAILLDVREQREWDAGHLRDATLLPLSRLRDIDPDALTRALPRDKVVYCHCAAGVRVLPAADILQKYGYDVRPLKAGYKELLRAGFPKAPR
jgi:rhodanese-related sulfurtransferase